MTMFTAIIFWPKSVWLHWIHCIFCMLIFLLWEISHLHCISSKIKISDFLYDYTCNYSPTFRLLLVGTARWKDCIWLPSLLITIFPKNCPGVNQNGNKGGSFNWNSACTLMRENATLFNMLMVMTCNWLSPFLVGVASCTPN